MYLNYLKERYNATDFNLEELAFNFESDYRKQGVAVFKIDIGFVAYKLEGDAIIITDLYTTPEARGKKQAWKFHNALVQLGRGYGKRVLIGFSEKAGKNHELGLRAMKGAGFVKSAELSNSDVFIKGI